MPGSLSRSRESMERRPLLPKPQVDSSHLRKRGAFSPYRRVLLATFLLSTTFAFTATPLTYGYRLFNCEEYYKTHPPYEGDGDACAVPAIEARTAKDITVMLCLATLSGTINLIFTTWQINHWGLRKAIVQQTFWPALRNLCQIYAITVGGATGIQIINGTQLITILGGGAGYLLSANAYMAEVVEPGERTAAFGVLAGMAMLGVAIGYIGGGVVWALVRFETPFQITFCLLVLSTLFTAFFLPYIPPGGFPLRSGTASNPVSPERDVKTTSFFSFLRPLGIFWPAKYADGSGRFWGVSLLGFGAFTSVMSTGYVPLMLQLTATNKYGFKPVDNGLLMSCNSLSRAAFLTLVFPRIISRGRKYLSSRTAADDNALPPAESSCTRKPIHGSAFDLEFLRFSMIIDSILIGILIFSCRSGHIWAAALITPLASGTAPACKGVLLDMVPAKSKAEALAGIALIETAANIFTATLYGALFACLSRAGLPNLIFLYNSVTALAAALVLFAVRYPRGKLVGQ
ncbi:unnamed protein product [Mycena citricolor]|uniref:MFS general substrate transporter n=1 Tax=Mycena citricolor TaxID=2018698 RepID=A0AAD2H9P5_9AGAR|nr:unnamed protein product [Mycena citricolor]CAK5270062.1 unnamed protein product [Mycena citricolor]